MFDPLGVHERVVHLVARAPPQPSASGSGGASTSARTSGQHPRHHIHHQHHHHHPPGAQHLLLRPIVTNDMGFFGMSPTSLYEWLWSKKYNFAAGKSVSDSAIQVYTEIFLSCVI